MTPLIRHSSLQFRFGCPFLSVACRLLVIVFFIPAISAFTACGSKSSKLSAAPILLFNGTGTSPNDVAALEDVLNKNRFGYITVNCSELNSMSQADLQKYRLLIVPGGDFIRMGNGLAKKTAVNIHQAVQHGLNYLGVCAGAFLAGNSSYYNGFNLTSGITFTFFSAEIKGIRKAAVTITSAGSATLDQYWEDGPQLSNWGKIVSKYPDGTPAVTEGKSGHGFVVLTGVHAEAPAGWRSNMAFNSSVEADNDVATKLVRTALTGIPLPHY
ncbi:MAG TPA: BPL-N domain-containing protein [Mucilaginibacter sp.]|nr:BPL-N domain-containing protein [Mucilaginibacter sp.]